MKVTQYGTLGINTSDANKEEMIFRYGKCQNTKWICSNGDVCPLIEWDGSIDCIVKNVILKR